MRTNLLPAPAAVTENSLPNTKVSPVSICVKQTYVCHFPYTEQNRRGDTHVGAEVKWAGSGAFFQCVCIISVNVFKITTDKKIYKGGRAHFS